MEPLLMLFGGTPARYWIVAALAGAALLWAAWNVRRVPTWVFVAAVAVFIVACRWPLAALNAEVGVDDSQALASAMRLSLHPIPWKYADLNTAGPLNVLPVVVLHWLGLPINYVVSHAVALAMLVCALAGAYLFLREESDERVARCGILPATAFLALTVFFDFAYCSSEHVSLALIGLGSAWLWQGAHRGSVWRVLAGTALLGATPWAKLQSVPLALWFCAAGAVVMAWRWRADRARLLRLIAAFFGGGVLVSTCFALVILIWGLGRQWYVAYIQQALHYSAMGGFTLREFWASVPSMTQHTPELRAFAMPLIVIGAGLVGAAVFVARRRLGPLVVLFGAAMVAGYIIAAPGRPFFHYLLFGVIPLSMLVAALLNVALDGVAATRPRWFSPVMVAVFLLVAIGPQLSVRWERTHGAIPYQRGNGALHQSAAARFLAETADPGDTLTVWGWVPRLHVESGLPPGTRDGQTERQISPNPLRDFYRQRYLFDLRRHRPRFFVEAIAPQFFAYHDRATQGFETWPELKAYVEQHYAFDREIEGFRIYIARPDHTGGAEAARPGPG